MHRTYSSAIVKKGVFLQYPAVPQSLCDAIMEQAASEVDNEKRAVAVGRNFQQIVMNDVPIYFMTTTAYHTIYNKRVGNVPASIWGFLAPYMDVYLKK